MKKIFRLFKFRLFRIVFVVLIITGGILFYQHRQDTEDPTCKDCNLILISVDTLRPDHMGVYGYEKNTTPNIDKWAKGATVFTNMRTVVPATYPSFATLMTGKSQFETKIYNNYGIKFDGKYVAGGIPLSKDHTTLASILKDNGYETGAYVTNLALSDQLTNINRGFNTFNLSSDYYGVEKYDYRKFLLSSLGWLGKEKSNKFFLWVHLVAPHAPYNSPLNYYCVANKSDCNIKLDREINESERKFNEGCNDKLNNKTLDKFLNLYDGEIAFDDSIVGDILEYVNKNKLNKNTIVILYGDHGEGFDHNYYFMHSYPIYDSAIRIPFIVKLPKNNVKKVRNNLDNSQILKFLLSKLEIDGKKYGINDYSSDNIMASNLDDGYVYSTNTNLSKYSVVHDNLKYIYSVEGSLCSIDQNVDELYELNHDPQELNNLAEKHPEIVKELKNKLFSHLSLYNLPKPIKPFLEMDLEIKDNNAEIEKLKSLGY